MNYTDIINRRKFLRYFGCCTCGLMISSCTTVPITERRQLKIIPESTLNRQAAQIYEKVKKKEKLSDNLNQLEDILEKSFDKGEKTLLFATYNNQNVRRYLGIKLN